MREFIREIFTGAHALFTGKFLAGFVMLPVLFASVGSPFPSTLSNIVNEDAMYDKNNVAISKIKEPDAGNIQIADSPVKKNMPIGIVESAPAQKDLVVNKITSNVVDVGLDSNGAVAVPNYGVGYYSKNGARLLVGHNPGIFSELNQVAVGDIISFRGENYEVYRTNIYDYDPSVGMYEPDGKTPNNNGNFMLASLYGSGATGLNLMTCYGSYLAEYGTYNQRLVVFALKV